MAWIIDVGPGKSLGIVFPALIADEFELALDERTVRSNRASHDSPLPGRPSSPKRVGTPHAIGGFCRTPDW